MESAARSNVGYDLINWFAQGGLEPMHETYGYTAYAQRLCRYISDPSTVRVRTLERYGYAPPVEVIRAMREEWTATLKHRAEKSFSYRAQQDPKWVRQTERPKPALKLVSPDPELIAEPEPAPVVLPVRQQLCTITEIIDAVALACDVTHGEIVGDLRFQKIVEARALAAAIMHARGSSMANVGRRLGNRDHTTARNALRKFFDLYMHRRPKLAVLWEGFAPEKVRHVRSYAEYAQAMEGSE